ncbi:hypothetical protein OEZ85_000215 [Tetradesmus obliquus]|uniref:Amine oxidase domain-containing protein n=1 Tax=Tetradesmus obliquus TaxID=3088 RepID=A0ABY8UQ77_TETOB|nr:hypothetical protein OEZ85_000215 [Tetradesmus obliquus]
MLRELGREVCAVERQKAWGGKLQNAGPFIGPDGSSSKDVEDAAHAAVGLAAMWVHGSQKSIRCLANQLNVTLETNSDDQLVHSRGQWVRGSVDNLATTQNGTYAKPAFDLEAAVDDEEELGLASLLWNCILGVSATDPLTGKSPSPHPSTACANYTKVRDYIVDAVGQEAYDFMLADTPEPFNYELPLDVCLWIDAELSLGRSMDTDLQLIPRGGWHKIVDKARAAAAAAGVRFFAGSGIDCISSVRAAERPAVYASASRQDAAAGGAGIIDDSTDAEDAFGGDGADATGGVHAPGDTEDDDAGADAADLNITDQPIVPIISDANVTAPAYQYNHLASGSKAGRVLVAERVIFASGPQDVRNLLGDVGMKLAQSHEVASIRGIEVVVYNAFYPNRWWEQYGAVKYANLPIRHVDDTCLVFSEFNHKDLLTPQALAAAVYINSGCNGAAEFANEVQVPTDVALPGFNPATGKPMLA